MRRNRTAPTGEVRRFASPPLAPGKEFTYEVRARWTEGGKEVSRARDVGVTAGARARIDFTDTGSR